MKVELEALFNHYLKSFKDYDLQGVCQCYALPCTLNTPDRILLLEDKEACENEFNDIFEQLRQEHTQRIVVKQSSFMSLSEHLLLVSIDWDFVNQENEVFADFCAFYHVAVSIKNNECSLKIVNVASHNSDNSLLLTSALSITQ